MAFQVSIPRPVCFDSFPVFHLVFITDTCYLHLERCRGDIRSLALDV